MKVPIVFATTVVYIYLIILMCSKAKTEILIIVIHYTLGKNEYGKRVGILCDFARS